MKIQIWSDFVCPFCYIGKRKLEEAISQFPQKEQIEIEFKSFQLDSSTPLYNGEDFYESMGQKFGGAERAKQMTTGITEQAKTVGLDLRFATMKATNTFDAHRLTKFAKAHGVDRILTEKILFAFFTESKDIGDIDTLSQLAVEVGLNIVEAQTVLKDKQIYAKEVQADIEEAKQLGITSVPHFLINKKYAISGGQPSEVFIKAFEKAFEEENAETTTENHSVENESAATATKGSCAIPSQKDN